MAIQVPTNFEVQTNLPLDSRYVAADSIARDAIPSTQRFEGLQVFVQADGNTYQLVGGITNGDWQVIGGGATVFTGLTDTPANYTGHGGKTVKVNVGETGLEFVTDTGGGPADGTVNDSILTWSGTAWTEFTEAQFTIPIAGTTQLQIPNILKVTADNAGYIELDAANNQLRIQGNNLAIHLNGLNEYYYITTSGISPRQTSLDIGDAFNKFDVTYTNSVQTESVTAPGSNNNLLLSAGTSAFVQLGRALDVNDQEIGGGNPITTSSDGGDVVLRGGLGGFSGGRGGNVNIIGGNPQTGNGGSITLEPFAGTVDGTIDIKRPSAGTAPAELRFFDNDATHYIGLRSPATVTTSRTWVLPDDAPTNGYVFQTDGSGNISLVDPATFGGGGGTLGGLSDVTITAAVKGDVLVYNGSAWVDITVGTNDQVLTADSTTGTGLKWATPAGGGNVSNVGTPVDGQIGVWATSTSIEGDTALTFDTVNDYLTAGTYIFEGNQAVGAGTDNYVLTYDQGDGRISLEPIPTELPTGTVINSLLHWNGSAWVEQTNVLASDTALLPGSDNNKDLGTITSNWRHLYIEGQYRNKDILTAEFVSDVADAGSVVAWDFNTTNNLTTVGGLLFRVRNQSVSKFEVDKDGDTTVAGHLAIADASISDFIAVNIDKTIANPGSAITGTKNNISVSSTGTNSNTHYGMQNILTISSGTFDDINGLRGTDSLVVASGATITKVAGIFGRTFITGGSITTQAGVEALLVQNGGAITNSYGVLVNDPFYVSGTKPVTLEGLRIEKQTQGGTTNRGINLNGDGVGADIVFGAGADASILFDGTDLILNCVTAGNNIKLGNFEFDIDQTVGAGQDNYVLTYDNALGTIQLEPASGGGATQLSDLSDVNTSTPTNRNVLVADGVDFESRALVEADISDLQSYALDTHTHSAFDRISSVLSGATVFSDIVVTDGITTAISTRNLTAGDIGAATSGHTHAINDLSDVNITTPAVRHAIMYDGVDSWDNRLLVEADISDLQAYLTAEVNDLTAAVTWANVPDANITQSSVTQHQAALSIAASQVTAGTFGGANYNFSTADVVFDAGISVDTISEDTAATGVTVDGVRMQDGNVYGAVAGGSALLDNFNQVHPNVSDGAAAIALEIDQQTSLVTIGAKLLSIANQGNEKFYIDKDGGTDLHRLAVHDGTLDDNILATIVGTFSSPAALTYGLNVNSTITGAGDANSHLGAYYSQTATSGTWTGSTIASNGIFVNSGATLSDVSCLLGSLTVTGGVTTKASIIKATSQSAGGTNFTDLYMLELEAHNHIAGNAPTNAYGAKVDKQTAGTSINAGIWMNGDNAGADVVFGDNTSNLSRIFQDTNDTLNFVSGDAAGVGAVGFIFDTANDITAYKYLSLRDQGDERLYISHNNGDRAHIAFRDSFASPVDFYMGYHVTDGSYSGFFNNYGDFFLGDSLDPTTYVNYYAGTGYQIGFSTNRQTIIEYVSSGGHTFNFEDLITVNLRNNNASAAGSIRWDASGSYTGMTVDDDTWIGFGNSGDGRIKYASVSPVLDIYTMAGNTPIKLTPHGTGNVSLGNYEFDVDQTVGPGQDNYVLTYDDALGTIQLEAAAGGGNVSNTGTPLNNQLAIWTNATTIEGDAALTFDTATDYFTVGNFIFDGSQAVGAGTDNYVLTYDNGTGRISLEVAGGGAPHAIDAHTDVTITTLGVDELLFTQDGSTWINQTLAEAGISEVGHTHVMANITDSTWISNVVQDTTPQLGGNLDVQSNTINTSVVNGGISIQPNGTGNVTLGNYVFDGNQSLGAPQDNYVLTYDFGSGLISLEPASGGGATQLSELSDVNTSTPTNRNVLVADGVDWESRALVEADISDLQSYSLSTHIHSAFDRVSSVLSGATVFSDIVVTDGITTAISTRDLTPADIGAATSGHTHAVNDLTDIFNSTPANRHVLIYDGVTDNRYENRLLVEADISDLGNYSVVGHTHVMANITDSTWISGITAEPIGDLSDVTITAAAKGDLLVYNGSAWVDLTVGANDQVLTADSTQATGVRWATSGSGATTFTALNDTPSNYTGAANQFVKVNATPDGLVFSTAQLTDLSDVNTSTPTNRNVLVADGVDWESRALVEADISDLGNYALATHTHVMADITDSTWISGITAEPINDLSDVNITTPAVRHALMYDGVDSWDNRLLVEADISDLQSYALDTHTHSAFDRATSVLSGATVFSDIVVTDGITTAISTRDLTAADIGAATSGHTHAINDISDVTITGPVANDEVLAYNGSIWINQTAAEAGLAAASHTHVMADITDSTWISGITGENLGDLSDVTITAVGNDEVLQFTGTVWENQTLAEAGIAAAGHTHALNDLTDVTITAAATGEYIRYSGSAWVDAPLDISDDTTPTLGGTLNCSNNDIDNAKTVTFNSEINVGTGTTVNWTSGQKQRVAPSGATTYTFTAPAGPCNLTLKVVNGSGNNPTWPATVKWAGGTEPTWSTGTDIASFYYDGTDYYGAANTGFA